MNETQIKISVIIADDHPLFLSGVSRELNQSASIDVIAETGNGIEALRLIRRHRPAAAVLDIQMPGMTGIEVTEQLRKEGSDVNVILLTMHNEKYFVFKALEAGVDGYVLKNDAVIDIVNAVEYVTAGGTFISPKLSHIMVEAITKKPAPSGDSRSIEELTQSEKKLLLLISEIRSNDEIAEILFISKRTIENQRVLLSKKLNFGSARDLLKFAVRNKVSLKSEA